MCLCSVWGFWRGLCVFRKSFGLLGLFRVFDGDSEVDGCVDSGFTYGCF